MKLILLSIFLVFFNLFAFNTEYGFGSAFFLILTAILIFFSIHKDLDSRKRKIVVTSFLSLAIFTALMPALTANSFIQELDLSFYYLSLFLMVLIRAFEGFKTNLFWWFDNVLRSIPKFFLNSLRLKQSFKTGRIKAGLSLVKSILLTILILLIFGGILASADPVFGDMVNRLLESSLSRLVQSVMVGLIFLSALTLKVKTKDKGKIAQKFNYLEIVLPATALSLLFGLFIFIQIKYLFIGHSGLQGLDLTYSDYVRQGFTQLLIASFLGEVIVYVIYLKQKELKEIKQSLSLKIINFALVLELFLILASALKRDWLYVQTYGLSRIRWVGAVFGVWLALVYLLNITLVLYKKFKEKFFVYALCGVSVLSLIFLNLVNMDKLITTYQPSDDLESTDYLYLSYLSTDVVDTWKESINQIDQELKTVLVSKSWTEDDKRYLASLKLAILNLMEEKNNLLIKYTADYDQARKIYCQYYRENDSSCDDQPLPDYIEQKRKWQSSNLNELRAYQYILENQAEFDKLDQFLLKIEHFQFHNRLSLYSAMSWRLYQFDTPLVDDSIASEYLKLHQEHDFID